MQACYRVGEIARELWEPIAHRDKDYIATPKANGYRSLHLTLRVPSLTVEVQPGAQGSLTFDSGLGGSSQSPEGTLPLELQIRTAREFHFQLRLSSALSSTQFPRRRSLFSVHTHRWSVICKGISWRMLLVQACTRKPSQERLHMQHTRVAWHLISRGGCRASWRFRPTLPPCLHASGTALRQL
jgi:hypothetical protein